MARVMIAPDKSEEGPVWVTLIDGKRVGCQLGASDAVIVARWLDANLYLSALPLEEGHTETNLVRFIKTNLLRNIIAELRRMAKNSQGSYAMAADVVAAFSSGGG